MKTIEQIREQFARGLFEFSRHANRRLSEREVSREEIGQAGSNAVIIEDYPDDERSPSCLMLGFTDGGRPLHIHASREDAPLVKVITLYEPDPNRWIEHSRRI